MSVTARFKPFYHVISLCALWLGAIALILLCFPVTLDIILRHTGFYFPGAFEIQELMMGVLTVCGMILISCRDKHIAIDFFYAHFPERLRKFLDAFYEFSGTCFFSVLGWQVLVTAIEKYEAGETTPIMHLPLWLPMSFFGVCMCLFGFVLLLNTIRSFCELKSFWQICLVVALTVLLTSLPWILEAADAGFSRTQIGIYGILGFMLLLFLGYPLGYVMGIAGFIGLLCLNPDVTAQFNTLSQTSFQAAFSTTLAVVPLFCLMGEISVISGISRDMFRTARVCLGRTPAALGVSSIAGCAGFAAICGDSLATGVTMASVALPEMRRAGYNPAFSCAILASGGTLGVLIPPSLSFIVYAIITEQSTGRLFMAGVVPGILLTCLFICLLLFMSWRRPDLLPPGHTYPWIAKLQSLKGIVAISILIAFVMGGILGGLFSATEAGAIGSVAVWLLALGMRRIGLKQTWHCLERTVAIAGKLMFILMCVSLLGVFIAYTRLTPALASWVSSLDVSPFTILFVIIGFYIILGCMMNVLPMLMLTLPTIYPTIERLGFDLIWFGVILVLLTEMAVITPPVGINVFGISSIAKDVPIGAIFRNVWLFFGCMALAILLVIFFPSLALWFPSLFFM